MVTVDRRTPSTTTSARCAEYAAPRQERGVRPARAIPYTLFADGRVVGSSVRVELVSSGAATGVFQVRSRGDDPRAYTVERGKRVSDSCDRDGGYDLAVHGPNGFFRGFTGGGSGAELDVRAWPAAAAGTTCWSPSPATRTSSVGTPATSRPARTPSPTR